MRGTRDRATCIAVWGLRLAASCAIAAACSESQPQQGMKAFGDAGAGGDAGSEPGPGGASAQGASSNQGGMLAMGARAGAGGSDEGEAGDAAMPSGGTGSDAEGGSPSSEGGNPSSEGGSPSPEGGSSSGEGGSPVVVSEGGSGGEVSEPECPKSEGEICHEFFVTDNARNQLTYVNEFDPAAGWTKPVNDTTVNSPRQVELVENDDSSNGKAVLVSVDKGYQEYDMVTGTRLVNVVLAGTTGIRGAVRLPNGNTLLGIGDSKLRVVDGNGTTVGSECTLPGAGADSLRTLTRDATTGLILLGRLLDLFIVSEACQEQWTAKLPAASKAYAVLPRPGGGVWATTGAPSTVLEYNQAGTIVGQVGGRDIHPGVGLDFFADFERLANGNIVVANWQGHIAAPSDLTPHLVELTPSNTLVWKWGNQTVARQITGVYVIR